jgi:hypothetical protein
MRILAESLKRLKSWALVGTEHIGRLDLRSRWIWCSILLVQVSSLVAYDLGRREILNPQAALIIAASFVCYWTLYPVLVRIVDLVAPMRRWAWILSGLVILGLSRGLLLEQLFFTSTTEALESFMNRAPGDITLALITLVAMSELMHSTRRHIAAVDRLTQANESLLESQKLTSTKANSAEANLRELAQSSLLQELDRIKSLVSAANQWDEIKDLADQIKNLITNEVRPLSRRLRERIDLLSNTKELRVVQKPLRFGRPNTVNVYLDTRVVGTYLLSMPNILVTIYSLSDLSATLLAFLASLAIFPIGIGIRGLFSKVVLKSRIANWLAMNAVLTLAYLPLQLTLVWFINQHPELQPVRFSGIGVFLFVGVAITLWRAIERSREQIETELAGLNQDLARSTAIVEQQVWIAQKKWAYLVHGTVQGALTVAASRLQLADENNPVQLKQILNDLDKAVTALKGDLSQEQSFAQQVNETRETWAGVLDLEIVVDKAAKSLLESSVTSRCASEIVKELAGNAYRHGKAKRLVVAFSRTSEGDLRLSASNDGSPLGTENPGLGSDLFSDLTMSWSFSNDAQGVNFEAELPGIYPLSESSQS